MKRAITIWILFLLLLAWVVPALAASDDVRVNATVDKSRISEYKYLILTVDVGGAGGSISDPEFPVMNDFEIVGSSQSSHINIINLKMTKSTQYTYQLLPLRTGNLQVPAIKVRMGKKTYKTKPIKVSVVKTQAPGAAVDDVKSDGGNTGIDPSRIDTFLEVKVDPMEGYVGQKLIVTYHLLTRVNLANLELQKAPAFDGFWSETLETVDKLTWSEVDIAGYTYRKALIRRSVLFPIRSGELTVDSMALQVTKRLRSGRGRRRDPFGNDPFGMFMGRTQTEVVASPPVKIQVAELPKQGMPKTFSGAVGSYDIEVEADTASLKAGEAMTYKVTVTGDGNGNSFQPPKLNLPDVFKDYKPKVNDLSVPMTFDYRFKKEYAFILVPQREGEYTVPPATVDYFDPGTGTYRTARSKPVLVTVLPGDVMQQATRPMMTKEQVQMEGRDIHYIKPDAPLLLTEGRHLLQSWIVILVLLLCPLSIPVVYFVSRRQELRTADVAGMRLRGAGRRAKKTLATAQGFLDANDSKEFYGEVSRALTHYVADKLNVNAAGLTPTDVTDKLEDAGASKDLIDEVRQVLDQCELYRFSSAIPEPGEMQRTYNQTDQAVSLLEKMKVLS